MYSKMTPSQRYYYENKISILKDQEKYRDQNKDKINKKQRDWRIKNKQTMNCIIEFINLLDDY